ncbi:hypothetical protein [Malonomonas rubra]|uniref:hypothetical protein n=1 Tax=Malonomonas rubra TaxID=57040 RepID=UPI0026F130D9|nr:hypothetical protein [Malonomonas rubra]
MTESIKSKMIDIVPLVLSSIGEHTYKAFLGFVVQEHNTSAATERIVRLQRMHDWLQEPAGS